MTLDFGGKFESAEDQLRGERDERLANRAKIMPFGISYLDEALRGIFPNDLIVIGATPGAGKTKLVSDIAFENVLAGRSVYYFALEAERREIARRMKYRELADAIWSSVLPAHIKARFNYIDWYAGDLDEMTKTVEADVDRRVAEKFKTLRTFYKKGDFSPADLAKQILAIQDQAQLIIVDHLHYLDLADENENRGMKDAVKRIRDLALELGKAVIVVAHLRKSERRGAPLVPTLDDFHGTSDISKIATKCIMFAPARDVDMSDPTRWGTYVYAPKCRMDASRTKYAALMTFNSRDSRYERGYVIGRLKNQGAEFEELAIKELPLWAKSNINGGAQEY